MVAVDTSTLIAFIEGASGRDIDRFDAALGANEAAIAPVVLTEILSEPKSPTRHRALVLAQPILEILPDYWIRAAAIHATVLSHRLRGRLPGALIAQSCIDHDVALITRDNDFRHFAKHCGLKLA
jgi:predicted nucleic acid-binding protein